MIIEITSHVFVTYELAHVLDCCEIAEAARIDELRAVIGKDGVRILPVGQVELRLGLPDGDELNARARHRRSPLWKLRQRRVGRLVEQDEKPRVKRITGAVVAV